MAPDARSGSLPRAETCRPRSLAPGRPRGRPPGGGAAPPAHYAARGVGVFAPVPGSPAYLAEALDCVLAQRPAPAAVVVVDDASPEPIRLHPDHERRCTL